MQKLGRFTVGLLAVLFSLSALAGLSANPSPGLIVGSLAVPAFFWFWFFRIKSGSSKASNKRIEEMSTESMKWISAVQSTGIVPTTDIGPVLIPPGEKALLACESKLSELTSDGARNYLGTRVKIGSMPLYLGGSRSVSHKSYKQADSGHFVLTNKSAYFVGLRKTLSLKLQDIVAIHPTIDALVINIKNKAQPVALTTPNPILWSTVIHSLSNGTLKLA